MPPPKGQSNTRISLIPGFTVWLGSEPQEFGSTSAKLVAYLALQPTPVERTVVAGTLWPHVRDSRAAANLRTARWRVAQLDTDLIVHSGSRLGLHPLVDIDYPRYERLARQVLTREPLADLVTEFGPEDGGSATTAGAEDLRPGIQRIIESLTGELLTHWYDNWLGLHQERWRQLRLHSLDSLAVQLTDAGLPAAAIDAATASVAAEPLRESGYRALMMAHLAEGNVSEVVRTHEQYCTLLERELGIAPSLQMYELLSQTTGTASASSVPRRRPKPSRRARPVETTQDPGARHEGLAQ
jgi:DNA-binding SARP family transcriptional activator